MKGEYNGQRGDIEESGRMKGGIKEAMRESEEGRSINRGEVEDGGMKSAGKRRER